MRKIGENEQKDPSNRPQLTRGFLLFIANRPACLQQDSVRMYAEKKNDPVNGWWANECSHGLAIDSIIKDKVNWAGQKDLDYPHRTMFLEHLTLATDSMMTGVVTMYDWPLSLADGDQSIAFLSSTQWQFSPRESPLTSGRVLVY